MPAVRIILTIKLWVVKLPGEITIKTIRPNIFFPHPKTFKYKNFAKSMQVHPDAGEITFKMMGLKGSFAKNKLKWGLTQLHIGAKIFL